MIDPWTQTGGILFAIAVALVVGIGLCISIYGTVLSTTETIELLNLIVLIITACIVWLYTKAAQRSNEIQERPVLNLYLRNGRQRSGNKYLALRNMGKGPAYNIDITRLMGKPGSESASFQPEFNEPNKILEAKPDGDEKRLVLKTMLDNGGTSPGVEGFDDVLKAFFPRTLLRQEIEEVEKWNRDAAVFLIHYESLANQVWYSVFRVYPTIPPDLDIVVEFVAYGRGKRSLEEAREFCIKKETRINSYVIHRKQTMGR